MRSEKGITLTSLVIYIIVMIAVISFLGIIINKFYENTTSIQADTEDILEFNKFNTHFLTEIKSMNNQIDTIDNNYILFSSGNSFLLKDNKIYYNDLAICNGVKQFSATQGINGDGVDKSIIYITLEFNNFIKSINYKIENIY